MIGGEEVMEEEVRSENRTNVSTFLAVTPDVTMSGEPTGRYIWVTRTVWMAPDGTRTAATWRMGWTAH